MKAITVSAMLTLCAVIAFQLLSYFLKGSGTQEHAIESGYVFFSVDPWCPDGSKVASDKRLTARILVTETEYIDTGFYTVCQQD